MTMTAAMMMIIIMMAVLSDDCSGSKGGNERRWQMSMFCAVDISLPDRLQTGILVPVAMNFVAC